jgi:hypothetical protein
MTYQAKEASKLALQLLTVIVIFLSGRRYLASNRDPSDSCHDWLDAFLGIEQGFLRTAKSTGWNTGDRYAS